MCEIRIGQFWSILSRKIAFELQLVERNDLFTKPA